MENISHILQYGITHRDSANQNPHYKSIGDLSLINNRNQKSVVVDNGVFSLESDLKTIILGDYIPFYFGVRMPMLYVAQNGGNFVEKATPARDIVYLVCSVAEVINSKIDFFFSDGHATDNLTSFFDATKIDNLVNIIDWNAVRAQYWSGNENLNLKRKKQAEFLISGDLTSDHIVGFGCYDEMAKEKLLSFGISKDKIKIIPNAFY